MWFHLLLLCEHSLFVQCESTTFHGVKRPAFTKPLDLAPHIIYTIRDIHKLLSRH